MKKIIFITAIASLFLTGCFSGENKITCTIEEDAMGVSMKGKVVAKYTDDKITTIKMTVRSDLSYMKDLYKNKEEYEAAIKEMEDEYKEEIKKGFKISTDVKNDVMTVVIEINLKAASDEDIEEGLGIAIKDLTPEELIEKLEEQQFSCSKK